MIIGWLRLAFFVLCASALVYLIVLIYARSLRREALEKEWDRGARLSARDVFVAQGMLRFEGGLRRRLLWLIFVLPFVVMSAIFFYTNWSGY